MQSELLALFRRWSYRVGHIGLRRLRQAQAKRAQAKFVGRYVAITGSCGKTTTTTFTGKVLAAYGTTVTGLHNVGVTLLRTVRKLTAPTDFVVQETSGHAPGALDLTLDALRVDVAVVTAVGFDHASSFRLPDVDIQDAIALEKGRLVEALAPGGLACLNFDDPRVRAMASRTTEKVVSFGLSPDADVRAVNIDCRWPSRLRFDMAIGDRSWPVETRFIGTIMLTNLLGALSVAHGLGLPPEPGIAALAQEEPVWNRMGVRHGRDGKTYIVDTEKAPYWSTEMLVADLPRIAIPDLVFVIADVSDIRGNSGAQYRKLLRALADRVGTLVLAGRSAEYGARLQSEVGNIVIAPTAFDVAGYLDTQPAGTVVYLKAGRASQLWRVLDQVTAVEAPHHA